MRKSEALKDLERMANEYKRIMHPDIPTHALPRVTYSDANTNDMQTAIIDYIDLVGGWATRINTQGQYVESLGRFIPGSTKKGTADIHGVLPPHGRHISIECKKGKDKLSPRCRLDLPSLRTALQYRPGPAIRLYYAIPWPPSFRRSFCL